MAEAAAVASRLFGRSVGRAEIGSVDGPVSDWVAVDPVAAVRTGAGRSAAGPEGTVLRAVGSRAGLAGGCAAGWASRVTVPLRLKLESSRGPILSAGAGGGAALVAFSCAASGDAASCRAAAMPKYLTKPLSLFAKIRFPSRLQRAFGLPGAPLQGLGGLGCVDQHQFRVIRRLDAQLVLALDSDSVTRAGGDAVHPDPAAGHQIEVPVGIGRQFDRPAGLH